MASNSASSRAATGAGRRRSSRAHSGPPASKQSARSLEANVLQLLALNEELLEFSQFEELSKLYTIESPYLAKSQIELTFDVYDGRKMQASGLLEGEDDCFAEEPEEAYQMDLEEQPVESQRAFNSKRASQQRPSLLPRARGPLSRGAGSRSWCKLLFARNNKFGLASCLSRSETHNEFPVSPSESANNFPAADPNTPSASELLNAALTPEVDYNNNEDDEQLAEESAELKNEVLQLIGPLLSQIRRSSTLSEASKLRSQSIHSNLNQSQQFLDLATLAESGQVSVCVLDKRRRLIREQAQNGRVWLQFQLALEHFCNRLRSSSKGATSTNNRRLFEERVREFHFKFKRKQLLVEAKGKSSNLKLSKEQLESSIELTKTSLNHLIDAQLLLRNKLSAEQQQQLQQQSNLLGGVSQSNHQIINRSNEYETLLRNNFNLLKIWQNFEETKHLACFVCEPIKANLADLFWFSRHQSSFGLVNQRQSLLASDELASGPLSCSPSTALLGSGPQEAFMLSSPLVSLDAIQVRSGLLQILEALHYLHAICKLIHRNVNPKNILIASNDNWKLSGLEFAIRFESATISESASIMAHEGAGSLLRYSSGVGSQATLRRQRTLHQTRCDDLLALHASDKTSSSSSAASATNGKSKPTILLTPDINYMAPELYRNSKCSHKSDIFSFGLVLAQTYDLRRHKPPINCKTIQISHTGRRRTHPSGSWQADDSGNYEEELKKLIDRRKRRLGRLVPFEMKTILLEMLDCEPNQRPSANYALQLQLLNLLCRGVDSLATLQVNNSPEQHQHLQNFSHLKYQFEQTFECLKQLYKSNAIQSKFEPASCCLDSRWLMLAIALHRRLLDQLALMRVELPPVCRLTAPNYQSNRVAENHRVLVELEDCFQCLVSRQSISKLFPLLTDPLLKLDEFLLLIELLGDLLAFVGHKCRQNFIQRGKQLLNELTPVTGCSSLSSSDEDEDETLLENDSKRLDALVSSVAQAGSSHCIAGAQLNPAGSRRSTQMNAGNSANRLPGPASASPSMSGHRLSDFDNDSYYSNSSNRNFRNLTGTPGTKISITAPSPMGSTREMNRSSVDSNAYQQYNDNPNRRLKQHDEQQEMIRRVSELSLSNTKEENTNTYQEDFLEAFESNKRNGSADNQEHDYTNNSNDNIDDGKSRNQLIDELLKTINDDNFNDYINFNNSPNNKYSPNSASSAVQLANSQRPKSAIDGVGSRQRSDSSIITRSFSPQQQQQQAPSTSSRPNTLALNNSSQRNQSNSNSRSGTTPSTFDNVLRRMSTNLVQNFNKMSGFDSDSPQQHRTTINITDHQSGSSTSNLLREKNPNYCANSLYVDNQIPARRHSDNTINIPRIQVALSSPSSATHTGSRTNLNQRASVSASKLANKWKLSAKTNQREAGDKLSPNLSGALSYMRRHSSGNTTGNDQNHSNGSTANLLFSASPFKTKSSSNLGLDFLLSNRSMKRRCSAASMLGHQTQRKAEDLIDAGMKSVQNMFS